VTRIVVVAGGALWLAACAATPQKTAVPATPAPVETPAAQKPPAPEIPVAKLAAKPIVKPAAKPAPTPTPAPATVVAPAPTTIVAPAPVKPPPPARIVRAAPEPAPPPPTRQDVLNLDPAALTALLRTPRLKRQEAPAEVWQYFGTNCVLHVFLYPPTPAGRLSVAHLDATDTAGAKFSTNACLAELAGPRRLATPQSAPSG
jgi:outer membrane biosynthesis protein TonB